MDMNPMQQDTHSDEMHDDETKSVMAPKSVFPGELKVGDEVTMKVSGIEGDMIKLDPCTPDESEMSPEDMGKMSEKDAQDMPLDKMEQRLPKANREY